MRWLTTQLVFALLMAGVTSSATVAEAQESKADGKGRVGKAKELLGKVLESVAEKEAAEAAESASGYLEQLKGLAGIAQGAASSDQVDAISRYLGDSFNQATEMGANLASSADWARRTYATLKENGMTKAASASQWLGEELRKAKTWEYKVVPIKGSASDLENQLNELGSEGWECFGVADHLGTKTILCKRRASSMLSQIPVDRALMMMNLIKE